MLNNAMDAHGVIGENAYPFWLWVLDGPVPGQTMKQETDIYELLI
jgi:hypothetical protein